MTIDITQVVIALLGVLGVILTRYTVPWIKSHISASNLAVLSTMADVAVRAAEELDICGKLAGTKAAYALQSVETALAAKNITYDEATITAAIKASVANLRLDLISSGAATADATAAATTKKSAEPAANESKEEAAEPNTEETSGATGATKNESST